MLEKLVAELRSLVATLAWFAALKWKQLEVALWGSIFVLLEIEALLNVVGLLVEESVVVEALRVCVLA